MNEHGFSSYSAHHLDPSAQEFFPTAALPSIPSQIYYPFSPSVYDNTVYLHPQFPSPPPYVNAAPEPAPPLPASLPPSPASSSRTLLLIMVPASVSESIVRRDLEIFGDVRAVQMERRREGLVTVHFYDVRDSEAALMAIQQQHMQQQLRLGRHYDTVLNNSMAFGPPPPPPPPLAYGLIDGRVVWAQFATPITSGLPDGNNQGTLVIFNLDTRVSASHLKEIFEPFGSVKELRETPQKRFQRFVEFFDVRDAARAMSEMDGKEIYGKTIAIDFSRPGGQCKKSFTNGNWIKPNCINSNSNPARNSSRRSLPPPSSTSTSPENPKLSGRFRQPKKGYLSRNGGSRSSSSAGSPSIQRSFNGLKINGGFEEYLSVGQNKKNYSKKSNNCRDENSNGGGRRPWEGVGGRRGKEYDPRFLINEDAIMESSYRDSRTTVMIKNIPNKYSQKLLLNMLDNHCIHCNEQIADGGSDDDQILSSYDFIYLPIDFINKCNVGYGFVNMTSPEATLRLYKAFNKQSWEVFNSRKICEVTYARLQGVDALREHFKNSKFPCETEEYMPVVFSPPRDGRLLSEPVPIVGIATAGEPSPHPLSPLSSATSSKGNSLELMDGEAVNGRCTVEGSYDGNDDVRE